MDYERVKYVARKKKIHQIRDTSSYKQSKLGKIVQNFVKFNHNQRTENQALHYLEANKSIL